MQQQGTNLFNEAFQVRVWRQPVEVDGAGLLPHPYQQIGLATPSPPPPQGFYARVTPFQVLVTHLQMRHGCSVTR